MITNFLLDNKALVPVVAVLLAVVCVGVGHLLLRVRRHGRGLLWALTVLAMVPVIALTLAPTAGRLSVACVVQFSVPKLGSVEMLANVALFVPPVYFATLATRRPLLTLTLGTVSSAAIETLQALLPAIGRACDTNDWTMNTLGAAIAVLLATATMALTTRRTTTPDDQAETSPADRPNR